MERILAKLGATKISEGYFYSDIVGSFMYVNGVFFYDPISSFEDYLTTLDFFKEVVKEAELQGIKTAVHFTNSASDPEKFEHYPKYLINLNDPSKEKEFDEFFESNESYISNNIVGTNDSYNVSLYIDLENNDSFTIGSASVSEEGTCELTHFLQKNEPFSLEEMANPDSTLIQIFDDSIFIKNDPDFDIEEFFENNDTKGTFYQTKIVLKDDSLVQKVIVMNAPGAEDFFGYYERYEDDDDESPVILEELYGKIENERFVFEQDKLDVVLAKIQEDKLRNLF